MKKKKRMKLITKEIPSNDYEKIFPKTKNFDQGSIIDFVSSLCEIAKKQFINDEVSKIFFLQKVIEVAESNLASALATKINGKANTSDLHDIAFSGDIDDLDQTSVVVFDCGNATNKLYSTS